MTEIAHDSAPTGDNTIVVDLTTLAKPIEKEQLS